MAKKGQSGKKGVFFTVLAVILVVLFISSFAFYSNYTESQKMDSIEVRIITMNEFLSSIEKDLERALYISGFRSLLSISNYISSEGIFIGDVDSSFAQIMVNGTIANRTYIESLMQNQTLINWTSKMQILADEIDLVLDVLVNDVSISHSSPWVLEVSADVNLSLSDTKGVASWDREVSLSNNIPVQGFEDPLYIVGSNGKIVRAITPSNITVADISTLKSFFEDKTFIASSSAPSYLQRLEGDADSSSPYGIETLVDTDELYVYGESIENRSSVDYIYFGSIAYDKYKMHNITDEGHPYFLLDSDHVVSYGVEGYNYTS